MPKPRNSLDGLFYKPTGALDHDDSLAELKRVYIYMMGSNKGYAAFESFIKAKQPEARTTTNGNIKWHLNTDKVFNTMMENPAMAKILLNRKIKSYIELSHCAFNF